MGDTFKTIIQPLISVIMGKGDKKTKRGKLFMGSFGVTRQKKGIKAVGKPVVAASEPKEKAVKEIKKEKEPREAVKEVKEVKEEVKETAPVKAAKETSPAKKETKAKKPKTE